MSNNSFAPTFGDIEDLNDPPEYTRESSLGEVAQSSFQLSWKQAETSSVVRAIQNSAAAKDDDITDHKTLNEEYRLPVPLNEPMSRSKFDRLVEEDIERKELQTIIQNGSGSKLETVVSFGSSMAAQIVDPIGIASGAITGTLAAKVMAKGALGLKAAKAGLGQRIVEGVAGNLIAEAAFVIPTSKQEQQDIDTYQNLQNAIYGGVGFPAAIAGLKLGFKKTAQLFNLAEQRINAGKKPFGTAIEMEAVTGADRKNLTERRAELSTRAEGLPDGDELFEVKKEIDEIDESLTRLDDSMKDEVALREEANSRQQDMYYDQEVRTDAENFRENPIEPTIKERVDVEFDRQIEGTDRAEERANLVAEKELHMQRRQAVPEAVQIAADCIRERFTGTAVNGG